MTIAPLAVLGIAKTAFSLIDSLVDAASRPSAKSAPAMPQAQESVWHQVGQEVDVTSMTSDELAKVAQLLYSNGAIDINDYGTMNSDPSFSGSSNLLTAPDSSGRVDWIAEFKARLAQHSAAGDTQAANQDSRVLDILGRLQAGSRGVTSIRV